MFGIENNRTISIERGQYIQIQTLEDWREDERTVYLKNYGMVKVFRQMYKKSYRYYIMSHSDLDQLPTITKWILSVCTRRTGVLSVTTVQ